MALNQNQYDHMIAYAQRLGVTTDQLEQWADTYYLDRIKVDVYYDIIGRLQRMEREREMQAAGVPAPKPGVPLATSRQVEYARDLIARRIRSGDDAGYFSTRGLVQDGRIRTDILARMPRHEISALIDSLRGTY